MVFYNDKLLSNNIDFFVCWITVFWTFFYGCIPKFSDSIFIALRLDNIKQKTTNFIFEIFD
jgi:hypothetical protein